MTLVRNGAFIVVAALAAMAAGCGKKEQPAVAPAAKTQPPPVIPSPTKPAPSYERDHYANLEDCVYDWGYAHKCTPVAPGSPTQQAGANFLGPIYAKSYREETQVQLRKEAIDGGYVQSVATDASDKSISKSEGKP